MSVDYNEGFQDGIRHAAKMAGEWLAERGWLPEAGDLALLLHDEALLVNREGDA